MNENVPTMNVGSGKIAGLGIGPDGEPGLTRAQQRRHRKRNRSQMLIRFKDMFENNVIPRKEEK
jgi:hypothetical protein